VYLVELGEYKPVAQKQRQKLLCLLTFKGWFINL